MGLNIVDGDSNKSVYGKLGMSVKDERMKYGVVVVIKRSCLSWFGHLERTARNKTTEDME